MIVDLFLNITDWIISWPSNLLIPKIFRFFIFVLNMAIILIPWVILAAIFLPFMLLELMWDSV